MNVSKPVAIAVIVALMAALLTVAYLLGLDHARRHQIIEQPPPPLTLSTSESPRDLVPVAPARIAAPPPPSASEAAPPAVTMNVVTPAMPAATAVAPSPANAGDAAAVRSYFTQMDMLAGVNPFGDDAEGTAEKLLASAMGGDTSGFDALAKLASDAVTKAQAITAPAACAHYHQESIAMLQESVNVLETLKAALQKTDSSAVLAIAGSAQTLKTRADALAREASAIKARYNIR